jgi:hypothetical protein
VVDYRHCERSEAIHRRHGKKEWIASRSLSSGAHSRDPLARNDEENLPDHRRALIRHGDVEHA